MPRALNGDLTRSVQRPGRSLPHRTPTTILVFVDKLTCFSINVVGCEQRMPTYACLERSSTPYSMCEIYSNVLRFLSAKMYQTEKCIVTYLIESVFFIHNIHFQIWDIIFGIGH